VKRLAGLCELRMPSTDPHEVNDPLCNSILTTLPAVS